MSAPNANDFAVDDVNVDLGVETDGKPLYVSTEPPKQTNTWLVLAIGILIAFFWYNSQQKAAPVPDDGDIVIVDDDKKNPTPAPTDLTGATLLYVLENTAPSVAQTELMMAVTTDYLQSTYKMAGFRRYDEEQEQGKQVVAYAVGRGVDPTAGLVAIVKDKQIVKVAPWPKDKPALEAFLK